MGGTRTVPVASLGAGTTASLRSVLLPLLFYEVASAVIRQQPRGKFTINDPIVGEYEVGGTERPNWATKHTLDLAKYPKARCLDGTPGAYYYSAGWNQDGAESRGQNKFFIFKMGGGACTTPGHCLTRSRSLFGSSSEEHGWLPYLDLFGYDGAPHIGMDRDQARNPLLWNWNHVYVLYCDGGYFAGSNATSTFVDGQELFFNGADIMTAVLDDLQEKYQLSAATDTMFSGCSAGALSTYFSLDWLARHPAVTATGRVAGFGCSGFFGDVDADHIWWSSTKALPFQMQNMSGVMSQECIRNMGEEPHKCFIPQINAFYINTPVFMWESQFDQWQLFHQYTQPCFEYDCARTHSDMIVGVMQHVHEQMPHVGMYVSGCVHHCEDSVIGDVGNIRPIDGDTPLQALHKWYGAYVPAGKRGARGGRGRRQIHGGGQSPWGPAWGSYTPQKRMWYEHSVFPCEDCCPQGPEGARATLLKDLE